MSIGINWKDIWGPVWGPVWAGGSTPLPTDPVFIGPTIDNLTFLEDEAIDSINFTSYFSDDDPLVFSVVGTLPVGLTLSSAGFLTGTPTTLGVSAGIVIQVTDGVNNAYSNSFSITISDAPAGFVTIYPWLQDLLPRTPGAVRSVVKRELLLACREFFVDSFVWRVAIGPSDVNAGDATYIIAPNNEYSSVVGVLNVAFNKQYLKKLAAPPKDITATATSPTHYYVEGVETVVLWPEPTQDALGSMLTYAALAPLLSSNFLPGFALSLYYDALLDGALGRLYLHPDKPYSNPVLAAYHLKRFRHAIALARAKSSAGNAGAVTWQFPTFGK